MKASKKPEEAVPALDLIEQATHTNSEGQEVQGWVLLKNMQFKHINLCSNDINDDCRDSVSALIKRTNDDFGITLAGNPISKSNGEAFIKAAQDIHATRVTAENVDQSMGIRRIAL